MPIDYIVASLQPLMFDGPAPYEWDRFLAMMPDGFEMPDAVAGTGSPRWRELETQLRNAMAAARGGDKYRRTASGCELYWQNRIAAAFQERNPLKRESLIDRVWWDAAGELTPVSSPLSKGALETYAIRLKIVLKRNSIIRETGDAIFGRLTDATEV
ncbi:MAG: hypothetical protein E7046_05700 [Lentisphaerae bacterium]|nr:hypothetical protein [Lentisphaerota bacterium]